ncbi:ankyrin repeat family protein [Actinidia rufa]|uniref:Ankyrin repeat family protein n=1 Tax=Actinidia rufa TaxID=165716 RepID=A0A7J0H261_9ERIC|nr:ankyrin repeat family protein [Actinidia rufa]
MAKTQKSTDLGGDLHGAARSGDLVAVQSICSSNPLAINSRDKHSRTPLHLAAWSGHALVVNYLCKNKADVGAAAMDDMGAIHFAAQKGSHLELAKYLVKKGASLSAKTKVGKIPLDLASSDEVCSFLVECKKQSNKGDLNGEKKAKEAHPKSPSQEKTEGSDAEVAEDRHEEEEENEKDESIKRKGDEDDTNGNSPMPKKAKVALNHLLTSDDGQEEEEIA